MKPRRTIEFRTALALAAAIAGLAAGCASSEPEHAESETNARLSKLPPAARATIEREIAGGTVDKVKREVERGETVYDVEATVGGKHMEYLVAADDGELLGTEVPVEFSELPAAVQEAAARHFGSTTGLTVMKGVEYGATHFEIEGRRNGRKAEATFEPDGRREE
jgi:hypothetical protein